MIAAELRGANRPSLNEALSWIGSRVDDIYGASVGRLEDVWIDPATGAPRWLLVKEGRFGGRVTLIPFEDATAGAGHVWVPYEREVVRDAPQVEPGAPLTQQVEAALRQHFNANAPAAMSQARREVPAATSGADRAHQGGQQSHQPQQRSGAEHHGQHPPIPQQGDADQQSAPAYRTPVPEGGNRQVSVRGPAPAEPHATPSHPQPQPQHQPDSGDEGAQQYGRPPAPASHADYSEQSRAEDGQDAESSAEKPQDLDTPQWAEIELAGGVRVSGELRSIKLSPLDRD